MNTRSLLTVAVVVLAALGAVLPSSPAQADPPTVMYIAIPNNLSIRQGRTIAIFIGKPMAISSVNCAPGLPHPQTVVLVDSANEGAQITGVLTFHDEAIPNGTRYRLETDGGPGPCNADLKLHIGIRE